MWGGFCSVDVPPSPKVQAYEAIVPSGSEDPAPETVTVRWSTVGVPMTAVGATFGGGTAATVTCRVTVPVSPSSSVTVNRTVYVPSAA